MPAGQKAGSRPCAECGLEVRSWSLFDGVLSGLAAGPVAGIDVSFRHEFARMPNDVRRSGSEQSGEEAVSAFTPRAILDSRLARPLAGLRVYLVTVFQCNVPQLSRFGGEVG